MLLMKRTLFSAFSFLLFLTAGAQIKNYGPSNAHSHNDYLNQSPLYAAFASSFGSIEADIFPVGEDLLVAHDKKDTVLRRSLRGLYINPLLRAFDSAGGRKLILLIDIKENYSLSLDLLIKELEPLKPFLTTVEKPNQLTIVISGERPPPAEYKNYPGFIFFDDDLKLPHTREEWNRVALVSLPFNKLSEWKGSGALKRKEKKRIEHIIDSVHSAGKPIRFWAAPDTETSWECQMNLGADLIGTDKVRELADFLGRQRFRESRLIK
jgi:alkaline phosphatase